MGEKQRLKWERRWRRMRAAGEVPKAGFAKEFTREEWLAFDAKRELEGRTLTLEERIQKRSAETKEQLEKFYAGERAVYPNAVLGSVSSGGDEKP